MIDIISYCDGKNDLIDISNKLNVSVFEIHKIIKILKIKKIIT